LSGGLPKLDSLVRIAEAAGVSVDWLATGEGPMRVQDLVATRLQGAEKLIALALDQIELDRKENNQVTLAEDVLAEGLQELRKIAAEQNATEQQRARADAVAEAVFQDEEAAARNASRMQTVGARARSAKERVAFACKEFDYTPGLVMGHVLQNLVFKYDVTLDDLAQLIQALQQE
jgi:hypothetical protein